MKKYFDKIMDECIDRINRGDSIDSCLADYPDIAGQLRPMLQVIFDIKDVYSFIPSAVAKKAAKERFNIARENLVREREERQPLFGWLQGPSRVWVTVTVVLIIAVIGYFGARPFLLPEEPVSEPGPGIAAPGPGSLPAPPGSVPEPLPAEPGPEPGPTPAEPGLQPEPSPPLIVALPSTEGNFIFLISDDVNAIEDFESVNVTISKISLLKSGDTDQFIEFEPEMEEVDLTLVKGDKTQEIWRGDIPEGEYTNVSIEVSNVSGILKETGQEVEIKLPGNKLHVSKGFQVSTDMLTSFTYDLTVVAAGGPENEIKYILKPQVDQSGADHKAIEPREKAKKEKPDNKNPVIKEDS